MGALLVWVGVGSVLAILGPLTRLDSPGPLEVPFGCCLELPAAWGVRSRAGA